MHRIIYNPRAVKVAIAKDGECNLYQLHARMQTSCCITRVHGAAGGNGNGNRDRATSTKSLALEPGRFEYELSPATQQRVFAHVATHRRATLLA